MLCLPGTSHMGISSYLRWLTLTSVAGVVVVSAVAFAALFKIEINGPVYRDIALSKDLVADYVPPSQSLLQIALICGMLDNTSDSTLRANGIVSFADAKAAFETQHLSYMSRVPEGKLKDMMRGEAYQTGRQYIEIVQRKFIPAIERGDNGEAHKILAEELTPLFESHSKAVDRIVSLAKDEAAQGEVESTALVRLYTAVMVGVALITLIAAGTFSTIVARAIARQANRMTLSEQDLRLSNQALRVLSECNSAVAKATDEQTLLREVCAILVRQAGYPVAWIGYAEPDNARTVRPVAWAGVPNHAIDALHVTWADGDSCCVGQAIRENSPTVTEDPARHWGATPIEGILKDLKCQSALAIPLSREGNAFGVIAVYSLRPNSFHPRASNVIEEIAATLATGILVLREQAGRKAAQLALEQIRAELEERVWARTAELLVAKDKAESADRIKSAFLATMSHELRTPLNSIIGFTGVCLQELPGPLNAEQKKQLGMVQISARHLLALINDVLDISKIEAGQLEVRLEPFDVQQTVERAIEAIRPLARKKGLEIHADIAPDVTTIKSDRRRVEQILLNLLSNAVKFTNQGSVAVKCAVEGGWLTTSVSDSGIGIAAPDLTNLFRPFHQLDTGLARRHEGTGLGLSICKRLSEKLGGSISVESRLGQGSTFSYRLPLGYY